jgi:hypothetical protein
MSLRKLENFLFITENYWKSKPICDFGAGFNNFVEKWGKHYKISFVDT